jgi:hypothetical protein
VIEIKRMRACLKAIDRVYMRTEFQDDGVNGKVGAHLLSHVTMSPLSPLSPDQNLGIFFCGAVNLVTISLRTSCDPVIEIGRMWACLEAIDQDYKSTTSQVDGVNGFRDVRVQS